MGILRTIENSARGRFWQWRLLVLAWIVYIAWRHLTNAEYTSLFGPLNLVFHELGHPLFRPFGGWMNVAGGTILQLLVPAAGMVILLKQHEFFGVPLCGAWLADNLYDVARYIADARVQARDYVTLGPNTGDPVEATHDWEFLLVHANLLESDTVIGAGVRAAATLLMWTSVAAGIWITWLMFKGSKTANE